MRPNGRQRGEKKMRREGVLVVVEVRKEMEEKEEERGRVTTREGTARRVFWGPSDK